MLFLLPGVVVECQTDRSQIKNRKIALQKLRAIIYQKQLEKQQSLTNSSRKKQVKYLIILLLTIYHSNNVIY